MNLAPGKYKFLVLAGQKDYEAQLAGEVHILCAVSQVRATRWKERWT